MHSICFGNPSQFRLPPETLSEAECYRFFGLTPTANQQSNRWQYLHRQLLTVSDQHHGCPSYVPLFLTFLYSVLSLTRSRTILDCCGMKVVRNQNCRQ